MPCSSFRFGYLEEIQVPIATYADEGFEGHPAPRLASMRRVDQDGIFVEALCQALA